MVVLDSYWDSAIDLREFETTGAVILKHLYGH